MKKFHFLMTTTTTAIVASYGWGNISRQTIAATLAALPIEYFYEPAWNGTPLNNGLSMFAASLLGGMADNLISGNGLMVKDLMRPSIMSAGACALFTFGFGMLDMPVINSMLRGENYIYLASFVFLTQILADILYKYLPNTRK
jgi:hypothetical protein